MAIDARIFNAKVMHKRLFPKVNGFTYGIYYIALPLEQLNEKSTALPDISINKYAYLSFYEKDHGSREGTNLELWIRKILKEHNINEHIKEIQLVCMPRVFGYVFNPVSFWLCFDKNEKLIAVLCEVNNTFGETHSYLCYNKDMKEIKTDDIIKTKKLFHVSPFLKREGGYKFRFSLNGNKLGIWIDFYDSEGKKQLITSLIGTLEPLTKESLRKAFYKHPLVTLKTIFLIHWQAIKLIIKGIKYIPKPKQLKDRISKN
ncbi:MAG: DUF1365 domain-containing protein [Rickettsiales bacterium]|nr:DUF1365 domain-containing protein [Pseudomonadota bacterium]MDA0966204.1 DUF1365 domain-containing protein [Pseudomonadota bacterium]MDG4543131.1 DUF1365 domain-containing protein [Rickettsiales bacterium]MDG4545329.1 DUF1365 domain-containing protein [Rickettsiales bacterium]MDG4547778.1 DUF1365 domain-containing protein [Rickettsiales bacterium]